MKVSQAMNIKSLFTLSCLALLMVVTMLAIPASAQRRVFRTTVMVDTQAPQAPQANPNLDQCANGKQAVSPPTVLLPCTGSNWQNGNLNSNNSQYVEGQSVTYRTTFTGASGAAGALTIQYDVTKASGGVGKHALDYLTTYTRTNSSGNNPCDGVSGCSLGTNTIFTIPQDPDISGQVAGANTVVQPARDVFTLFGGTILNVGNPGSE